MSKDGLDFEWTVEDVDKAFLEAARGEETEENKVKAKKPNLLNRMQLGNKLANLKPRKEV
jgi:hypothetical protein